MDFLIGQEWNCSQKGLTKKVLSLRFERVQKPTELSNCRVKIANVSNLKNRESDYLSRDDEFLLEMGTARTPVDCYVEILVQNMILGETSVCQIQTKTEPPIAFEVTLSEISSSKYLFQLTVQEMYDLAQKYRNNGVVMFKLYPRFAHDYFSRAAKCLISFKPFKVLTKESNGVDGSNLEELLQTLQSNIAACLLQEQRYEDVIYLTEFVDALSEEDRKKMEKAVYRRALGFFNIKEYEKVLEVIEKVDGMQGKKEFLALYKRTKLEWRQDEDEYKTIVQRMFN